MTFTLKFATIELQMAYSPSLPEAAPAAIKSIETSKLIVRQPTKLAELTSLLETFENLSARVSEKSGEDRSGDMGGGSGGGQGSAKPSSRDAAIAAMPAAVQQQKRLEKHIRDEIRKLDRQAKLAAMGSISKPGSAHALNDLYAKIRRLNGLLSEILEASVEVLKRLYIRVFIDRQQIL